MAKIDRVEVLMVDLQPQVKRTDAIQSFVSQETPIVRIFSDDGLVGAGYSYTIGTGGHAMVDLIARHLAPVLIGRDPALVEAIWRDLLFHTHATSVGAITSLALCAIDMALWDMRCLKSGHPLHIEAGGAQSSIPLYTTEGGWLQLETAALVEDARRAKAAGFGGAKIKIGRPPHEDVARLGAVRAAVGDDFEIMVDANQAFTVDAAIRRARLYEPFDLAWYEEPLPADDIDGHVRLSAATATAADCGRRISLQPFAFPRVFAARRLLDHSGGRRSHRRDYALAEGGASRRGVQRHDMPAFPDGDSHRARLRGPERPLDRIYPAA